MALTTYGGLKTSIASFINRTDLTTAIPDFVVLAESLIRKKVEARSMETTATGTRSGETLAHPADMLQPRILTVGGVPLKYVTPEQYDHLQINTVTGGKYTTIGSDFHILGATSGDEYVLIYDGVFTALADDADTNFVLTNAPEVYLWSSLHYAAIYMKDMQAAMGYMAAFEASASLFNTQEKKAKTGGARAKPGAAADDASPNSDTPDSAASHDETNTEAGDVPWPISPNGQP